MTLDYDFNISIVIVNYNVKDYLFQCLASIRKSTEFADQLKVETIVVDNDSIDGSVEYLEQQFPDVKFIVNKKNCGIWQSQQPGIRNSSRQVYSNS
jgi:GT2 family glycosyltransferase